MNSVQCFNEQIKESQTLPTQSENTQVLVVDISSDYRKNRLLHRPSTVLNR